MLAVADLHIAWSLLELRIDVLTANRPETARVAVWRCPELLTLRLALRDAVRETRAYVARNPDRSARLSVYVERLRAQEAGARHGNERVVSPVDVECSCGCNDSAAYSGAVLTARPES